MSGSNTPAPAGGKKGKFKGKTVDISELLTNMPPPGQNWAEIMENQTDTDNNTTTIEIKTSIIQTRSALPSAPRTALGPHEIDLSRVPNNPPFEIYVGNISFDAAEDELADFFTKLTVTNVRLVRDNQRSDGQHRGFGYVTFDTRDDLIAALNMNAGQLMGRELRIDVHQQDPSKQRQQRSYQQPQDRRSNHYGGSQGYQQSEYDSRLARRKQPSPDYSAANRGWREQQSAPPAAVRVPMAPNAAQGRPPDYYAQPPPPYEAQAQYPPRGYSGYGEGYDTYPRSRDHQYDRRGYVQQQDYYGRPGYGMQQQRPGYNYYQRDAYGYDGYANYGEQQQQQQHYGEQYPGYGSLRRQGSYRDRYNSGQRGYGNYAEPRPRQRTDSQLTTDSTATDGGQQQERRKLQLLPRSKSDGVSEAPTTRNTNIFGEAKPVDTTNREKEIEEKLEKEKEELHKQLEESRSQPLRVETRRRTSERTTSQSSATFPPQRSPKSPGLSGASVPAESVRLAPSVPHSPQVRVLQRQQPDKETQEQQSGEQKAETPDEERMSERGGRGRRRGGDRGRYSQPRTFYNQERGGSRGNISRGGQADGGSFERRGSGGYRGQRNETQQNGERQSERGRGGRGRGRGTRRAEGRTKAGADRPPRFQGRNQNQRDEQESKGDKATKEKRSPPRSKEMLKLRDEKPHDFSDQNKFAALLDVDD